jgi:hypothetical protein
MWRESDFDANGNNDFWTLDLVGLYGNVDSNGDPVAQIQVNFARADDVSANLYGLASISIPKSGYLYAAMTTDEDGAAYAQDPDGDGTADTNNSRFGFTSYPDVFGTTGKRTYIINESGTVYSKDTTGAGEFTWPGTDPTDGLGWAAQGQ